MNRDQPFNTVTMARVHAQQGNLEEAERVYRYLLEKEPGRPDLVEALEALEARSSHSGIEDLLPLFRQWLDLIFRYNQIQKLKKLNRLGEGKQDD
jgi:pentatricopeptide repeat protein